MNIQHLKELFPEIVTDGKINFETLRQLLGDAFDDDDEKFGLNWHGKRRARQLALMPSTGTLRPAPQDSVDWDTTQHLMIEGDNLEVLKLLQKSYAGRVKLIYIDPPYNTGDDRVYQDDFEDNIANYLEVTGQRDGSRKLTTNVETSGRLHTNWLSMMYPRLKLAHNLLALDGVLAVSINDVELGTLRMVLDELFGEENFEGHIHWRRRPNQPNDPTKMLGLVAEHILCYSKNKDALKDSGVGKIGLTGEFSNPDNDPRGDWSSKPWKVGSDQSGSRYEIRVPSGRVYDEEWMGERSTYEELLADNRIVFPRTGEGPPRKKYFRSEREAEGQSATNWWPHDQFGHNQGANAMLTDLFGVKNVFSNPKPVELIQGLVKVSNVRSNDIVVDFFAGSGTTAHAVEEENAEDGLNRRYILVQLPEPLDPDNNDEKAAADYCDNIGKPRNIAELTKERLRRAAGKIREEHPNYEGDLGFRVFKLDSSNIRAWDPRPEGLEERLLEHVEHLKGDRTEQDVLYELLLKLGLDLCVPIETKSIADHTVHSIGAGTLFACLEDALKPDTTEGLALGIVEWRDQLDPAGDTTVVFRDSAFPDDVTKTNIDAILKQHDITNVRSI